MNYDQFLELMKHRRTTRRFKPDPIPDDSITKILEAAHYAMSGANSQPWEFVVVKNPEIKKQIYKAYVQHFELMYALEQQRVTEYRHPGYNMPPEEKDRARQMVGGWQDAPVYIVVLQDWRKMFGSVIGARREFVLDTSMGHVCMSIHLAVASLGLASQRVDISVEEPHRQILKYPEPLHLTVIIPVGYGAYDLGVPHRLPVKDVMHIDQYDMSKFLRNEDFLEYMAKIRALGRPGYRVALGEGKG